jgi:hypothetical protein
MRAAILLLLVAAAPARASEPDRLIAEGVALRRQGRDRDALERFRRANALAPSPRAVGQMGFAEQALGRWVDSERDLSTALASPRDPWVMKNREPLERSLALVAAHLGTLEVTGTPAGAEVRIDGEPAGALPLAAPVRVVAGTITVEIAAHEHVSVARPVAVPAGGLAREHFALVAVPKERPVAVVVRPPPPRAFRIVGWTLLGASVPLLVAGAVGAGVGAQAAQRFDSDACVGNGLTRAENCGGDFDTAQLGQRLAISGFLIGGALLVGAVTLLAIDAQRRRGR